MPTRDSVYPTPSNPGVDALHYGLRLRWAPATHRLHGTEVLTFRAARTTRTVRLALGPTMHVRAAKLDGHRVRATHPEATLVIDHAVRKGSHHTLRLQYAGMPPKAPPLRAQRDALGIYHTSSGDAFTNDEPVGAHHWYAVNDQPSDKAFYDFRLSVPAPRVGVANGRMVSRKRIGHQVVTRFHLDAPAASYLTTVEFGRYRMTRMKPVHGVPITLWTPAGEKRALTRGKYLPTALRQVEKRLGPYPFGSLSVIIVKGYDSGMENQTLITLGDTDYDTSNETLVHEVAHQWYGDLVTPRDWRDVWMNEGMATYLGYDWVAQHNAMDLSAVLSHEVFRARMGWDFYGPPGKYHRGDFAADNAYFPPALMWDQLRHKVGSTAFWSMVRAWPAVHAGGNASRAEYLGWVEKRLGRRLSSFFHAWLMGTQMPAVKRVNGRGVLAPRVVEQRNWL